MKELLINTFFCTIGACIAAFALECFLVPNQIIDGGIVGISIMSAYVTKFNLGILLVVFNLPFFFLAFNEFGKGFIAKAIYSVSILALFVNIISTYVKPVTDDLLLSALFGGGILGTGVGLILKNGSCLDGTEILAMKISKNYPYSVGEIIMFFNIFIFLSAGFLFGWEQAMYSTLTYLIAYRVIDTILQGFNEEKSIRIITDNGYALGEAIIKNLDKTVTYLEAQGGYTKTSKTMIYCVVPRIELNKLKNIVANVDKDAFLSIENVHEVYGKRYKKS